MCAHDALLPKDALAGKCLGISVSESSDLARLGLLESHFQLALAEITRCVLVSSGHLAYGGHLDSEGYTAFMIHELERYSRRDQPLRIYLSWSEHRKLSLSRLEKEEGRLGLYGTIVYLDPDGHVTARNADRGEEPPEAVPTETIAQSLTSLRRYMSEHTAGQLFLGGKRVGFQGSMPGLLEEAILAVEREQPIFLAAGFGGVTYDIAKVLGVNNGEWFPSPTRPPKGDSRLSDGLDRLEETARATDSRCLQNGLTVAENLRLSSCHRPSEIASLISVGLGRRFSAA